MKKYLLSIFTLILPLITFAQDIQEVGIDQRIDEAFGDATGWFVNFIFYQIQKTLVFVYLDNEYQMTLVLNLLSDINILLRDQTFSAEQVLCW